MTFLKIVFLYALALSTVLGKAQQMDVGTIFKDYMEEPDDNFAWFDTGVSFPTLFGGRAHVLNVTSIKWLNDTVYEADGGHIWTHQVAIVVPRKLVYRNISNIYIASVAPRKNTDPVISNTFDFDLLICDGTAL